ncbi:MAG: response regulator transcription factor [Longimonas sp.]|uniref:response regulator transcription factor n=1 Tax=Longimonas sp. TaxID=2039626 RepID=UPI00334C4FD5
MSALRIVLADDHAVVRRGLRTILEASDPSDPLPIEVVGEAGTGPDALRLVEVHEPDVLLLDVEMPGADGVEVAQTLDARGTSTAVLALSSHEDPIYVQGLLRAGASGYLTKEQAPTLIREAVRAVAEGQKRWFVSVSPETHPLNNITERERTVLRLLIEGDATGTIAEKMNVAPNTVRKYASVLYDKIGVEDGRSAIAWAWKQGVAERL